MSGAAKSIGEVFSPAFMLYNAITGSGDDGGFKLPSAEKIQEELAKQSTQPTPNVAESKADQLVALEQQRADKERRDSIRRQLLLETTARRPGGFGIRSLFGALGGSRSSLLGSG